MTVSSLDPRRVEFGLASRNPDAVRRATTGRIRLSGTPVWFDSCRTVNPLRPIADMALTTVAMYPLLKSAAERSE